MLSDEADKTIVVHKCSRDKRVSRSTRFGIWFKLIHVFCEIPNWKDMSIILLKEIFRTYE